MKHKNHINNFITTNRRQGGMGGRRRNSREHNSGTGLMNKMTIIWTNLIRKYYFRRKRIYQVHSVVRLSLSFLSLKYRIHSFCYTSCWVKIWKKSSNWREIMIFREGCGNKLHSVESSWMSCWWRKAVGGGFLSSLSTLWHNLIVAARGCKSQSEWCETKYGKHD